MALAAPILALLVALVLGDLLILAFGQSPAVVYRLLLEGTWGNPYGIGQVLYKATTLYCTGLAVALGMRAGLFNVGAESQLALGGFCAALAGLWLPAASPFYLAVPLALAAAAVGGAAVGFLPGILKARFGSSEVIVSIMLNFVVLAFLNWIVSAKLGVPESLHTEPIRAASIPRLAVLLPATHGSAANLTVLLVPLLGLLAAIYLFRTRWGFETEAVGLQAEAAEAAGISAARIFVRTMLISGAVAGLGGSNFVLGYKRYYEDGFTGGAGFLGIAVALVGQSHPLGVALAAIFFATLSQGGLAVNALVPKQMVEVLMAAVILIVAVATPEVRRLVARALSNGKGS
jgi:ABC-type uncharacterized transport system permease subunit